MTELLRLVRRPAGRASPQVFGDQTDVPESGDWWDATLPDDVGLQRPRHPHARRALDGRGRATAARRSSSVSPDYADNTKFADEWLPAQAGTDARAGDGDGPRDPQGVLRRPPGAVLHRLREAATPTCPSWSRSRSATATLRRAGKFLTAADLARPGRRRERRVQDRAPRRARPASRSCRTARWASATARRAWAGGTSTSASVDPPLTAARRAATSRSRCCCPRFDDARRRRRGAAARRAGPPGRRAPGDHRLRPDARPVRRRPATGCPGSWPTGYDDADEPVHARLAGADHRRPAPTRASGSPASSPRTPRSRRAAR